MQLWCWPGYLGYRPRYSADGCDADETLRSGRGSIEESELVPRRQRHIFESSAQQLGGGCVLSSRTPHESCRATVALLNKKQETTISAPFVPGTRFLVLDFG
eukprot:2408393-Rhodomonas_salina.1